ncbi:SNF2 domain-containing protein [Actinidia rufa]|uniref:SNF2 domain-containing protein n=1 Tax=Actinidia rufa TaxID=165716 RepID=A0A7J0FM63_9ERIC|nr:SNF2 domain-containing protein [Actinidia rufa]
MASKGPRSKLDHETRARRQKALEASKEPRRPKTHWDHVLEEMVWLSKDFESERKWKLAQAKKVAIRASKGMLDPATRGEKKVKVLYKHQLELDEKKKKALDKQLEFLLGQTERYSTMLAENLVNSPISSKPTHSSAAAHEQLTIQHEGGDENESQLDVANMDEDFDVRSEDESEDDEHTIEEDEALITEEERQEELAALHNEVDLPLEELLKRYAIDKVSRESSPELNVHAADEPTQAEEHNSERKSDGIFFVSKIDRGNSLTVPGRRCGESNGSVSISEDHTAEVEAYEIGNLSKSSQESYKKHTQYDFHDEQEDGDFVLDTGEEKDDETTLLEEEELAKAESNEPIDEVELLQKESEIPLEELLARYKKEYDTDDDVEDDSQSAYTSASGDFSDYAAQEDIDPKQQHVPMEADDNPSEVQPVVDPIIEEEVEPDIKLEGGRASENIIADAAAAARSAQPTGNTFLTTKVRTKFPFLLKYPLREYQHIGLDWLVTMYEKRLNGILADEMGLGKTIMTIALLAHLACEKGIWGPHLIVVPTSVMLNWETEFLKWCPAFKILTYFGSAKERKIKRQGWMKPNSFHMCITTYRLVIQDSKIFKRKKWKYLILDEAHLIKNWKSQRWQTLLNFNSKRRILLTGTPLQNDLMELWSLMHFLMPHVFQSHQEFKDWFSNPISGMVEGQEKINKEVVDRLHNVLRPFILRRLKRDVEKQLPMKLEHVVYCRLSKRQRNLYEDFIASSETQATLASSNFFGMISVIMQLRKVCNHPDLFEGRPIVSSFDMNGIDIQLSSSICSILTPDPFSTVDLSGFGFLFTHLNFSMTSWESEEVQAIATPSRLIEGRADLVNVDDIEPGFKHRKNLPGTNIFEEIRKALLEERLRQAKERAASIAWWNSLRCRKTPIYSTNLRDLVTVCHPVYDLQFQKRNSLSNLNSSKLADIVLSPVERFQKMIDLVESFMFAIPAARAPPPVCCGGVGINLVGADTVIFYDSDWNPAMDQQAQDRCHRIGQTREVHIYRLISQSTIEENILRKANQKRALDDLVIQSGGYNTEFFKKLDPMELFSGHQTGPTKNMQKEKNCTHANEVSVSNADVEAALKYAEDEADYMALKKVEQEEAVENQEFTEEVIGRLEDDEFINEDEMKVDESADPNSLNTTLNKEKGAVLNESDINEDRALTFVAKEDDVDMLADVKQMAAAAAAAGQAILSFESQLRPIDRYAIRFLELWDPIIDKTTMESEVRFEESEWELDRIEKLKEDMEAEIDDDEEPFVYEKWDADFATEAYRQEVEALAQHQLLEDLACEAKEEEHADHEYSDSVKNDVSTVSRPKSKKKPKKAKFKSLKKGTLASESKAMKKELPNDSLSIDDENTSHEATTSSEVAPLHSTVEKKRKAALDCDEVKSTKKSKKVKKAHPEILAADSNQLSKQLVEPKNSKLCESVVDLEQKPVSRSKMGGKISITPMPVKRVLTIKPEKFKKKGNIWSRDCLPSPDFWMPEEDAMLCVLVHEYGPHWSLVSETLYGMTAGGLYRGRYRHPVHCCERFRELIQRYVLSAADNPNNEKTGNAGSGKALLKVTEDNIRVLLDVATELPDSEALLQKHFFALLSSIWRMTSRLDRRQSLPSSRNGFYAGGRHYDSMVGQIDLNYTREPSEKMEFTNLSQCSKLVAAALCDANSVHRDDGFSALKQKEEASAVGDWLEITLELQRERDDSVIALPSVINLLISGKDTTPSASMPADVNQHLRSSQSMAENRFRMASRDCTESSSSWASSAFQTGDVKYRTASKSQTLGKHKLSICEPVKPSKSKARKTALDLASDIITPPIADLQPMITLPINSIMSFDLTPPVISDVGIDAFESSFPLDMDEYWLDSQGFDLVPHDYVPGFISGLDDYSSLPKFTDIG